MVLSYGAGKVGQSDTQYWATFEAEELIGRLKKKREEFLSNFDQSGFFSRIKRSWYYYHALEFSRGLSNTEIRVAGERGELRLAQVNEYKTNIDLLATYIVQGELEWDALAVGDGADAENATRKVNKLLDGAAQSTELRLDSARRRALKHALVMTCGYGWVYWDQNAGDPAGVSTGGKRIRWKGIPRILNPSIFDVTFDTTQKQFEQAQWVECRRQENRWDLAAEYAHDSKKKKAILDVGEFEEDRRFRKFDFEFAAQEVTSRDHRWVYYFYHKPCPSLPNGRFLRRIGDVELEDQMRLPDGHVPVSRLVPGEFLLTPFGFTDAFCAQGPQEALNMAQSTMVTNQHALGPTKLWKKKGEPLNRAQLEPGITLIESETEPKPINFLSTPPEVIEAAKMYANQVQRALHVNDTAHGDPDPSIKAAAAMAFAEQRVAQAASETMGNERDFSRDLGTSLVMVYAHRMDPMDVRTIDVRRSDMSRTNRVSFTAGELKQIKGVSVVQGNPATRTKAGRIQIAEVLLQNQVIGGDEYLTVIHTGKLERLTEAEDNQLKMIHEENDALLESDQHAALPHHNHMLHMRRHLAQADSQLARLNPEIGKRYQAAALEHKQYLTYVDTTPVLMLDQNGQPFIDPMTGQPLIDEEQTKLNQQRAKLVQEAIEWNKLLGFLPPTFIPFGAPPPPPMPGGGAPVPGGAPVEGLETNQMGMPPTAGPPAPAAGGAQGPPRMGGGPRMTGVPEGVGETMGAGAAL